jgi:hypothetical protein
MAEIPVISCHAWQPDNLLSDKSRELKRLSVACLKHEVPGGIRVIGQESNV